MPRRLCISKEMGIYTALLRDLTVLHIRRTAVRLYATYCGMKDIETKVLYQNKYRKTSMRLQGWDYSTPAFYFITMLALNGILQFGNIQSAVMILNDIGEIISGAWKDSFEIRKELVCDSYIIMPNHIHGLISIIEPHGCASLYGGTSPNNRAVMTHGDVSPDETHSHAENETHSRASLRRISKSISSFVAGFKSTSTKMVNEYKKIRGERLWQKGYYDLIIRNENELFNVWKYIQCNPMAWDSDEGNHDCKIKI